MEEKELLITEKGAYKNINPKEKLKVNVDGREVQTEEFVLDDGYVTVTKRFAEGIERPSKFKKADGTQADPNFSCGVVYKGEDVSFWLNSREHEAYKVLGGVDDVIKIKGTKNDKWLNLSFELVE